MISDLIGSTTEPVIRKRITRVAMTMIPNAIGRWRARLDWKSTKSAVAPPTRTVAPGGAGMPRIRLMVSLLGSELNGYSDTAWITVTPSSSRRGGRASATPSVRRIRAASATASRGVAPSTETQIGVSR